MISLKQLLKRETTAMYCMLLGNEMILTAMHCWCKQKIA